MKFCAYCGKQMEDKDLYCPYCGKKVVTFDDDEEAKKLEEEQRAKEEAERLAKLEAEKKAKEEAERLAKLEAEKKAKEEAERLAKEEAERKAEEEAKAQEEKRINDEVERRLKERMKEQGSEPAVKKEPKIEEEPPVYKTGGLILPIITSLLSIAIAVVYLFIKDMFEPSFPVAIASGVLAAFSFINGIRISASKKYRPFVRFLNAVIIIVMIGVAAYIAIMELGEMPGIRH